jgi:dihydrofolate reductase
MEVILLMAATVDGKIARHSNHAVDWTGKVDKEHFVKVTKEAGVIIMGSKTYDTIGKPLPGRFNFVMTRDSSRKSDQANLIFTGYAPAKVIETIESMGYTSAVLIGGPLTNKFFILDNLITQIQLVVVPRLFGSGLSFFPTTLELDMELSLYSVEFLGEGHVLINYRVGR